jgi:hypothetical protein
MITLPPYTSYAFKPLNVACFKTFKITFIIGKDIGIVKRIYMESNKISLARWVNKTLDQTLARKIHIRVQRYRDLAI